MHIFKKVLCTGRMYIEVGEVSLLEGKYQYTPLNLDHVSSSL